MNENMVNFIYLGMKMSFKIFQKDILCPKIKSPAELYQKKKIVYPIFDFKNSANLTRKHEVIIQGIWL